MLLTDAVILVRSLAYRSAGGFGYPLMTAGRGCVCGCGAGGISFTGNHVWRFVAVPHGHCSAEVNLFLKGKTGREIL